LSRGKELFERRREKEPFGKIFKGAKAVLAKKRLGERMGPTSGRVTTNIGGID